MDRRPAVCLVDDDPGEITWFREAFKARFLIGAGPSVDEALSDLRRGRRWWQWWRRKPRLFLLDLYYPDEGVPDAATLNRLRAERTKVLRAQAEFRAFLTTIGQSSDRGFAIAASLRSRSLDPYSFFTRKGTLEDAIKAYEEHHATSVIKKPEPVPPSDGTAITQVAERDAFRAAAGVIAGDVERAINRVKFWGKYKKAIIGGIVGFLIGTASSFTASYLFQLIPPRSHSTPAPHPPHTSNPTTPRIR